MEDFLKGNPILNGMDPLKLQFLMNFAGKEKPATMQQAMPFLIANMNQAKKQNIHFSDSEIHLIIDVLTKDLSEEEKNKVKRILSLMGK